MISVIYKQNNPLDPLVPALPPLRSYAEPL